MTTSLTNVRYYLAPVVEMLTELNKHQSTALGIEILRGKLLAI